MAHPISTSVRETWTIHHTRHVVSAVRRWTYHNPSEADVEVSQQRIDEYAMDDCLPPSTVFKRVENLATGEDIDFDVSKGDMRFFLTWMMPDSRIPATSQIVVAVHYEFPVPAARFAQRFRPLGQTNYELVIEGGHDVQGYFDDAVVTGADSGCEVEGHRVVFHPRLVGPNDPFDVSIELPAPSTLTLPATPLGLSVASEWLGSGAPALAGCVALLVLHALRDLVGFAQGLFEVGLLAKDTFLVAIPYSAKPGAVDALRRLGVNVIVPAEYPFDSHLTDALEQAAYRCTETGKRLLVIEDGGYVVPLLHEKEWQEALALTVGAVEQTRNGIWADTKLEEDGKLQIPVMSVAESHLKIDLESGLIGRAVVANVERLLNVAGADSLYRRRCLVVGAGATGKEVARCAAAASGNVWVWDTDAQRRQEARDELGATANVLDSEGDFLEMLSTARVVIGCTGRLWLGIKELSLLGNGCTVVNASSKRREVDWDQVEGLFVDVQKRGPMTTFRLGDGRSVNVLAHGLPVNFHDSESVNDTDIQFIYGLLGAAGLIAASGTQGPGIHDIPSQVQRALRDFQTDHVWDGAIQ